jgi:biopolymer transport protein ExbB
LIDTLLLTLRDFMERGGFVLLIIAVVIFAMWTLILNRIVYLKTAHERDAYHTINRWHERSSPTSWHSEHIYSGLVSTLSMRLA